MPEPQEHPSTYTRQQFLRASGGTVLGLTGAAGLLAACGGSTGATGATSASGPVGPGGIPLARPDRPVVLPLYPDNQAVKSGLSPESGPLEVFIPGDYINPKTVKAFEKEFNTRVHLNLNTTNPAGALAKLATRKVNYDVVNLPTEFVSKVVAARLVQPLNHSYLPNLAQVIPSLADPFYDKGSRYSLPYTMFKVGIGYRADKIEKTPDAFTNPYDIFWNAKYAAGRVGIYDDVRLGLTQGLLGAGLKDVNTDKQGQLAAAQRKLQELNRLVNVKIGYNDYTGLPTGDIWLHQSWAGNVLFAVNSLKGVGPEVLGFHYPQEFGALVGNDEWLVFKGSKHPVLAHAFLNFLLEQEHAVENFTFTGFQPPLKSLTPEYLIAKGLVPENLKSCVITPADIDNALVTCGLTPSGESAWENAWSAVKAGK